MNKGIIAGIYFLFFVECKKKFMDGLSGYPPGYEVFSFYCNRNKPFPFITKIENTVVHFDFQQKTDNSCLDKPYSLAS
jgi:hypothetical protein